MSKEEQAVLQNKILTFVELKTAEKKMVDYFDIYNFLKESNMVVHEAIQTLLDEGRLRRVNLVIGAILEPVKRVL
jgi:hypothetical protein